MILAFTNLDYAVVAFCLVAMVGVGVYFRSEQRSCRDFLLAGRAMDWVPVGLSVVATSLAGLGFTSAPGEAYYAGCGLLAIPIAAWLALPLLNNVVLPLYHRLRICSVFEYLELRFDAPTRTAGSLLYVVWRLVWLGSVLYASCVAISLGAGLEFDQRWMLVIVGLVGTLYTFLGGMKAVIWTNVIQFAFIAVGLLVILTSLCLQLDGGAARVLQLAEETGRADIVGISVDPSSKWSLWAILPFWFLVSVSSCLADQTTGQRYLTTKVLGGARRACTLHCLGVTIMTSALMAAGLALLAFYHDHPQALRPIWVANVDHVTRESVLGTDGKPLIGWGADAITAGNLDELVRAQRLLRPNTREPFSNADDLVVWENGAARVNIQRLAMRKPVASGRERGEMVLNRRAQDELLPHYVAEHLSFGLAGLVFAAFLAAAMSAIDSGIHALCTLAITDFHQRLGMGRAWLARRAGKSVTAIDEAAEVRFARSLVLVIGVSVTLISLVIAHIGDLFAVMSGIVTALGAPLLAVFLLGILSRRTTARAACWTLVLGTVFTGWLVAGHQFPSLAGLWPWHQKLQSVWLLPIGTVAAFAGGYLLSLVLGRPKGRQDLRGLVVGCGTLGVRKPEFASIAIPDSFEQTEENGRS